MTREQLKSHFVVHTNGQDEWIKVDKRTYDKAIDMFCDAHETEIEELRNTIDMFVEEAAMYRNALDRNKETYEAELKAKDQQIEELKAEVQKYNSIAANLQISRQKAYDNIAELEAIIEKMKSCENCDDCGDDFLNWELKGAK